MFRIQLAIIFPGYKWLEETIVQFTLAMLGILCVDFSHSNKESILNLPKAKR